MFNNFTDFLCEAIKFAKGKDNDYFFHNYAIITFNKGDVSKYKVEGKTAGLWGHACKHLNQIDWPFVQNVVKQVKQTLIQYVKEDIILARMNSICLIVIRKRLMVIPKS